MFQNRIAVACGNIDGTNLDLKREIFASDIIVLTPQILLNALKVNLHSGKLRNILITSFSMISIIINSKSIWL